MARIVWSRTALAQFDLITAYIAQFYTAAAQRLSQAIVEAGDRLRHFPRRGRPRPDGTRELVRVRPYVIRYDVSDDRIVIVSIRYAAQLDHD